MTVLLSGVLVGGWVLAGWFRSSYSELGLLNVPHAGLACSRAAALIEIAAAVEDSRPPWRTAYVWLWDLPAATRAAARADLQRVLATAEIGEPTSRSDDTLAFLRRESAERVKGCLVAVWAEALRSADVSPADFARSAPPIRGELLSSIREAFPDLAHLSEAVDGVAHPPEQPTLVALIEASRAAGRGDVPLATRLDGEISERGRGRLRWLALRAGFLALAFVLAAWFLVAVSRRPPTPVGAAAIPSQWSAWDGVGAVVRVYVAGELAVIPFAALSLASVLDWPAPSIASLRPWADLTSSAASLAAAYWITRRLLTQSGDWRGVVRVFGLAPPFGAWPSWIGGACAALLAAKIGSVALVSGVRGDLSLPWPVPSLWQAPGWMGAVGGVETVLLGPFTEEIIFRGILFASLTRVVSPLGAAILSSLVFSAAHRGDLARHLDVAWMGAVYAFTFTRFRSVVPPFLAHALGNLWAIAGVERY